jgi:type IV pilus assembly protein PilM
MNWNSLKNSFRRYFGRGAARFVLPTLVLEVEPQFVVGARLDTSAHSLRRLGARELQPNAVVALPNGPNITDAEELRRAVRGVTEVIGNGAGRLGLLLPDASVRVAILTFETLPDDSNEANALVRWRMKESLPYPTDEANLSYQVLWKGPGEIGLMVAAAKKSLLAEYAGALGLENGGADLILPATAALLPLLPETEVQAQLLVHVCSGWVTTVVMKGTRLSFWRTKAASGTAEALSREIGFEVSRVLASTRDFMHVEPEKVWLCARPPATPELAPALAAIISKEVAHLAPAAKLASALPAAEHTVFESVGAPMAGLIANVR